MPTKILMKNSSDKLDLIKPGIFLLIFLVILGGALFFLNNLNKQRKNQVYEQYKAETEQYIAKNKAALIAFFPLVSDKITCGQYTPYSQCIDQGPVKDHIDHQLTHDLKDWSSTMFLAPSSSADQVNGVRLSGEIFSYYGYREEKKTEVIRLLKGEKPELPWDDYSYDFPGKEVIIPVKNEQGKVVGAIVRGVIEEKSF